MKSEKLMYSPGKNDECMTPAYAVKPILEYIPPLAKVWCPFDKPDSEFAQQIAALGNYVTCSHIHYGQDFFEYEPSYWDIIISNPPFTNKRKFFERALSFHKPFALLMSNTWLNDSAPMQLFKDRQLQLLLLDKRTEFIQQNINAVSNKITFSSSYYCNNFLPRDIIVKQLDKTNDKTS